MSRIRLSEYSFLIVSIISLFGGLWLDQIGSQYAWLAWAVGAAIGLALAINWVRLALKEKEFGSDSLAVIAILATGLTDEWLAASVISVMLATGRALEKWAEGQARKKLELLLERAPRTANRLLPDGTVDEIPVDEVRVNDKILVRSGEVVPIDGELTTPGTFDESALTGEPLPHSMETGSEVESGVVNASGSVVLRAMRIAEQSTYANLIRLVKNSSANSASGVRIANKWAVFFVPFSIAFALLTWLFTGEVDRAVAVIVAATPCPLILAVPVALISGMSRASAKGAIIKGGAALERLARAKTVMVDKTGTLTHGGPAVTEVVVAPEWDINSVLSLVASLEQHSPHVVAKALVAKAREIGLPLFEATEVTEIPGEGISGVVSGSRLQIGQPNLPLPNWAPLSHALLVSVTIDNQVAAILGLDDPIRADAKGTIASLRGLGVSRVLLVSGDREETSRAVGEAVGVDEVYFSCKPEDKLRIVSEQLELSPGTVVFAGDGINDAPALTKASAGVAMGAHGTTAASEAADVVIVEDSIKQLAIAIDIAKGARSRAKQAAGGGMTLAMVAMVAASLGLLNATGSAVAQEFIDIAAILWALVPTRNRV
ncbi:MAG: heavy metal translocating P-type ATPase [Actinomycetota bacterium]